VASSTIEENQESSQQQRAQQPGTGSGRAQLVTQLIEAANLPAFMNSLLTAQAITVVGTEAAGFLIERGEGDALNLRPIAHVRPDASTPEARTAALDAFQNLVKPCIAQGKDGAIEVGGPNDAAESQFCLVTLLRADNTVVAVSAVVTRCINIERAKQRLMSMQLVAGYFELFTLRRTSEQNRAIAETHQHAMQLSTAVATAEGFESAAMNLCNELATRSGATRVSLGWIKGRNVKVRALSHTEEFDKKQELIVLLEKVMEECVDQEQIVEYDPSGENSSDNVTRDAAVLSRNQGGHSILSLPLRQRAEIVGVVTLEFLPGHVPTPNVARGLSIAVDLLAPQLFDRHSNDRWLVTKAGLSAREGLKMVVGPKHMLVKICTLLVIGIIVFISQGWYKPMYHVSAPFEFAPIAPHSVTAPSDGYISRIAMVDKAGHIDPNGTRKIKPGDMVNEGDILVELDTTDLRIKLGEAKARMSTKRRESEKYRAEDKTAESEMALDEAEEARCEADYLQNQIDRAVIKAPFGGQILKGDLEDKFKAPVKQGDVLFEIGTPENLRIELEVNDRDIQDIKESDHAKGRFATNALPDQKFEFTVDRIIPLGQPKEGNNVFKVYGTIDPSKASESWRPGMAGEARVDVAPRRIIWIWTHRLTDFLKLKLWMGGPGSVWKFWE
jgi:biotin carboxyl carrier protein